MSNYNEIDTDRVYEAADKINNWNGDSVRVLKDLFTEFYRLTSGKEHPAVDTSSLPHRELIPEDLRDHTAYPIWACDRQGYCLTGSLDSITHADEIREYYNE